MWINPEESIVLQIKCSELVPSGDFSVGCTCRYEEGVKLREMCAQDAIIPVMYLYMVMP